MPRPLDVERDGHDDSTSIVPRIIYQAHCRDGNFEGLLRLLGSGVTHVNIATINLNSSGRITLNDAAFDDPKNQRLWDEVDTLQQSGIKVVGMLGGARQGFFTALDGDAEGFEAHYARLNNMLFLTELDGLDFHVEEAMSMAGMIRLIDRLRTDFGRQFLITLTPVAPALLGEQNLSGFDYQALEKAFGVHIDWYNTKFYHGSNYVGTRDDYNRIIHRGWPARKIVVGLVPISDIRSGWTPEKWLRFTLSTLMKFFPDIGGILGWDVFDPTMHNELPGQPWKWVPMMKKFLINNREGIRLRRN